MTATNEGRPLWLGSEPRTIEEVNGEKEETVSGDSDVQGPPESVDSVDDSRRDPVSVPDMRTLAPEEVKKVVADAVYQQFEELKEELYAAGVMERPKEVVPQESVLVQNLRTAFEGFSGLHDFGEILTHFRKRHQLVASVGTARAVLSVDPQICGIEVRGEVSKREPYVFRIVLQGDGYNDPIRAAKLLRRFTEIANEE